MCEKYNELEQNFKKDIIYFYLKQYKNTNIYFEYKYSNWDIKFDPYIKICKFSSNHLIDLDVYIYHNYINDKYYYFSRTVQNNLLLYYQNEVHNIFKSYFLLNQL